MSRMPQRDMARSGSGVRLTYDDFVKFPEDGMRHELIDGVHYVTPSPNLRHQDILGRLFMAMGTWLESNPIGKLYVAPLDVILSEFDVVEPDLLFVSNERAPELLGGDWVTGAPDLVVEIGSKSTRTRDETLKLHLYEQVNILEYWIVDPTIDAIRVYRREGERYVNVQDLRLEGNGILETKILPGLSIPLAKVFPERNAQS